MGGPDGLGWVCEPEKAPAAEDSLRPMRGVGPSASRDVQSSPENRSHADCLDTPSASPMRVQLVPRARKMPT
jgi:hypothetical protein